MTALKSEVHVWLIPATETTRGDGTVLTDEEWQKAERFHNPRHGQQWASFRAALRVVLARYANCRPLDLTFNTGRYGKPWLEQQAELQFNLSHSTSFAVLAVTRMCAVGVDVELIRDLRDLEKLVTRNFSKVEQRAFFSVTAGEREATFYTIWTRKEAVLKASGMGLQLPLQAFDVPHQPLPEWVATHINDTGINNRDYWLKEVSSAPNYTAAIALTALADEMIACPELVYFNYEHA